MCERERGGEIVQCKVDILFKGMSFHSYCTRNGMCMRKDPHFQVSMLQLSHCRFRDFGMALGVPGAAGTPRLTSCKVIKPQVPMERRPNEEWILVRCL